MGKLKTVVSNGKYHQGYFKPTNPEKYIGDPTKIRFMSAWELKVFIRLDSDKNIKRWASEEIEIKYLSPIDQKVHRYYPDIYAENISGQKFIIEIKPEKQTLPPAKPKKNNKRYLTEVTTYMVNKAKWAAAEDFCNKNGLVFKIATEKSLGITY